MIKAIFGFQKIKMSINAVLDVGNTSAKLALMSGIDVIELVHVPSSNENKILGAMSKLNEATEDCIISSVIDMDTSFYSKVKENFPNLFHLNALVSWPFKHIYRTPDSLGTDRVAAISGLKRIYEGQASMVIDAGTCITYDVIDSKGVYVGGAILPGINMQFGALHEKTGKLPLIKPNTIGDVKELDSPFGLSTQESMEIGVYGSVLKALDKQICDIKQRYANLVVIITGGDAAFFERNLKNKIFANLNLNLIGLNYILEHNKR
jgi:type III pantothenate kinase